MDTLSFLYYLDKVLPGIDTLIVENRKIITDSSLPYEEKLSNLLINYFNKQRNSVDTNPDDLLTEAKHINKLFPKLTVEDILEQLELFKDMPNRREIVLRTILRPKLCKKNDNLPILGVKRGGKYKTEQKLEDFNNYCQPIKIRKVSDGITPEYAVITNRRNVGIQPIQEPIINNPLIETTQVAPFPKVQTTNTPNFNLQSCNYLMNSMTDVVIDGPFSKYSAMNLKRNNSVSNDINLNQNCASIRNTSNLYSSKPSTITSSQFEKGRDTSQFTSKSFDYNPYPYVNNGIRLSEDENKINSTAELGDNFKASSIPFFENSTPVFTDYAKFNQNKDRTDSEETITYSEDTNKVATNETTAFFEFINNHHFGNDITPGTELCAVTSSNENPNWDAAITFRTPDFHDLLGQESTFITETKDEIVTQNRKTVIETVDKTEKNVNQDSNKAIEIADKTEETNLENDVFDLIAYLHDITNAPLNVIKSYCERNNLLLSEKPELHLLEKIVDYLLTNPISSDSEESRDVDIVDLVLNLEASLPAKQNLPEAAVPETVDIDNVKPILDKPEKAVLKVKRSSRRLEKQVLQPIVKDSKKDITSGPSTSVLPVNTQLVSYLCAVFPDACPDYIKTLCQDKAMNDEVVDTLTTFILNSNGQYPKRKVIVEPEIFPENQLDILKEFLPDADPDYLSMMCDRFRGKPDMIKQFLNESMERRNYPTLKEYQRRQQLSAQQKQYTTEFNPENFLKLIPDPHKFFTDPSRVVQMDELSCHYALVYLRNSYCKLAVRTIQSTFTKCGANLTNTIKELEKIMQDKSMRMKSVRRAVVMPNSLQNIPLLQEIAYYTHRNEIDKYLLQIKEKEEEERQEAMSKGLMKTCECCYDEEVLPKNIFSCENGCSFCKSCVVKSTEVRFGEGKLDFPCLMDCSSQFSLQTLQAVLSPKLFSKIAQKKALEEVKSAGIEELETCPFCDFATIPAEGYSIFSCLNPDCMKESCRFCKEPSHIPFRCDEIEKDDEVKARTFVENKMTEALLKKCWKCGIKFFKEEGCNKMTCSCGASMCYVCGKPVTDYKHFNGNGGDRFDLCPLYSDTNVLNKQNVLKAGEQAKAEIGNKDLKHDPTKDVDRHYKERAAKFPEQQQLARLELQARQAAYRIHLFQR